MKDFWRFLAGFFRSILVTILPPILLIAAGAGLAAAGLEFSITFLMWVGVVLVAAGLIWGVFIYFAADSGSFWD